MRIKCRLFGCAVEKFPECEQCRVCGTNLYDREWIDDGWLEPLIFWVEDWFYACDRVLFGRRCSVCGKRFRRGIACSDECNNQVPF